MEEKRQSCDLTEFIMNALDSKLAEEADMGESVEQHGEATSINIDGDGGDDEVFHSNHLQNGKTAVSNDKLQDGEAVNPSIDSPVIKRREVTNENKDIDVEDSQLKDSEHSHVDKTVAFSFQKINSKPQPKNGIPLAWNLLSKKRKRPTKTQKKKSGWAKVRDNIKTVNFMRALTNGDVNGVKHVLQQNPSLITYTDDTGISALEKAVNAKSFEILKTFIDNTSNLSKGDVLESAILYAIKMDCVETVAFLLEEREKFWKKYEECNTPKSTPKTNTPKWYKTGSVPFKQFLNFKMKERDVDPQQKELRAAGIDILANAVVKNEKNNESPPSPIKFQSFENSEFSSYTTPIILAAKLERLDIIKLIIERDASEIHPMTMPCPYENVMDCDICSEQRLFKRSRNLENSNHMIEIYRALSSPAYILLSGVSDPVLEAFVLSRELEHMQEEDPPFKFEYGALSKKCRLFAEELLGLCRTTEEVETMLRREEGVKDFDRCGARTGLSRVIVAMNYKQKEFIAHPYCQQVLQKSWYKGLPQWVHESEYHYTTLLFYYLFWLLVWPIACIIFMLKIWPRVILIMKYPINKYITDTLSYLTFLICLIINSIYYDHSEQKSGDFFNALEILMILWIFGHTARQFKMFWRHRTTWQRLDFVSLNRDVRWTDVTIAFSFFFWAMLRLAGYIYGYASGTNDESRIEWYSTHPILIAEAFYCAGTVLAFLKLSGQFITSSTLGPMHISLKKMVNDILRFLTIFVVIMIGFIVAIKTLYSNYADNIIVDSDTGEHVHQNQEYVGFKNTINTLFWHIFGYGDVEFANIVVNRTYVHSDKHDLPPQHTTNETNQTGMINETGRVVAEMVVNHHSFTEGVGYTLVGTYHIFILIVLLNMLIAMMNNSYQAIVEDSDKEWKFARTRLRMTYYNEVGSLPPPFNVWILGTIMKYVIRSLGKCIGYCKTLDEENKENIKESVHRENECEYRELIEKINKRYWNKQTTKRNKEIVIAPDSLENLLRGSRTSMLYGSTSCA